jgi:hypothetical protein
MKLPIQLCVAFLVTLSSVVASADLVQYQLPGTTLVIMLQGETSYNAGGTVNFIHPQMGKLVFGLNDVKVLDAPTPTDVFRRKVRRVKTTSKLSEMSEAADWALKHGLIRQFYEAIDEVGKMGASDPRPGRVAALKAKMAEPLTGEAEQEHEMRRNVRKPDMKVAVSEHFIMLYDTDEKPGDRKKPLHQSRLDLLERVYEAFLLKFYSRGVELEIPKERLQTILFSDKKDYMLYATSLSPSLASTAGFWDPMTNLSVFYDRSSDESSQMMKKISLMFDKEKEAALRQRNAATKHIVRMANTMKLLIKISMENKDIEVVSHEGTHQMAGNTGLFPRHVAIPAWGHEGLATYFEAPDDAAWSGMGAVNRERLAWYRALEPNRQHRFYQRRSDF